MRRKAFFSVLVLLVLSSIASAANLQVITSTTGEVVVPAKADRLIEIKALAVIATNTTSVGFNLYNGDNYLLGNASTNITVDLDGGDGPMGFIMPYQDPEGWFLTDTANEAVKLGLSAERKVIVVVIYNYKRAY